MNKPQCTLQICADGYPNMVIGEITFSWKVENTEGCQKAYKIHVRECGSEMVWNSGRIETNISAGIPYEGIQLESNRDYEAQVIVEACDGEKFASAIVSFSTGLINIDNEWKADWLTSPYVSFAAAPVFRKEFSAGCGISRARLFICGLGYYELFLNGKQVGDRYMDPAWTNYNKRVNYVAYDLTKEILPGKNAIGVCLGAGWYSNSTAKPRPVFSLQLIIEYMDGTKDVILTKPDGTWMSLKETWMLENTLYIGEVVDSRLFINGWCDADFEYDCGTWRTSILAEPPAGKLVPMRVEPIRCVAILAPESITEPKKGVYIVDFGQNMAAIPELKLHDTLAGDEICIRYSELLDNHGMLNTENLRQAQQCDRYIANGGEATYKPRFTYHGFRYAEITGLRTELRKQDILAYVIRTDVAKRSTFTTSNELINSIQRMCVWTESSNIHSVPTDCPQRNERLGWLNDLTVRLEEQVFNFDVEMLLKKYLEDIMDEQGKKTGAITDTVPYVNYGSQPADPVCSSYLLIPYLLYRHYGDKAVLKKAWPGLKAWTDYLANCRVDGIVNYSYYGDWAAPIGGNVRFSAGSGAVSAITPGGLMSSGFFYLNCRILEEIAHLLSLTEEQLHYGRLALETAQSLNQAYLSREKGYYAENSQASNVFMLYLNIVPDDMRAKVLDSLVQDIIGHDTHITTGNICSRYILDVLADNGKIDLAYALATQTTYPSWGYMLSKGATTTWERWEYVDSGELVGMASHNHPMYSTISGWFYKYLAGIRPIGGGFGEFELRPFHPQGLEKVSTVLETVKGKIKICWTQQGNILTAHILVPFNSVCRYTITCPHQVNVMVDGKPAQLHKYEGYHSVVFESGAHTLSYHTGLRR